MSRVNGPRAVCVVLVSGFAGPEDLDRFVKAEIRYFKSMAMQVFRTVSGELKMLFEDLEDPRAHVLALSRAHPELVFERVTLGRESADYACVRAGAETDRGPLSGRASRLLAHRKWFPEAEEIYSTF